MPARRSLALDVLSQEDLQRDKERATAFWVVALVFYAALVVSHPPTEALGAAAGWVIVAACFVISVVYVGTLRRAGAQASEASILVAALVGAVSVGVTQWLCGGIEAPLELLFALTVFGVASVLPPPMLLCYLVTVTAVIAAPAVYDTADGPDLAAMAVFTAILWVEGLLVVEFGERLRQQRYALHESEQAAIAHARTDALTGLGNRRALDGALGEWFARTSTAPLTVVYLDLNGFKSYNDRFGHSAGDALLRRLGAALVAALGPGDRAFRVGGDEFCVLLSGRAGERDVAAVVAALGERGRGFTIDASWGVVGLPEEADGADAALRLADERMYAGKTRGRPSAAEDMSRLLLGVIAEREPNLHEHATDVVALVRRVALRLGCTGEQLDVIVRAAEQHDVGKLAMPDAILRKPGPLDEAEWELMRQHTVAGERILATVPALREVGRLVRSSHERWDGGGYPDGLAGERIPLGSRIVTACDAYAAMRGDRPYRRGLPHEQAVAELQACSGTQFDPAVVELLVAEVVANDEDRVDSPRPTSA